MQCRGGAPIGEGSPVAGVEVALAGQDLGQQHIVRRQFDMEVGYVSNILLNHGAAVDEIAHWHEDSLNEHGVVRGQSESAAGDARPEGVTTDTDGLHVPWAGMTPKVHAAMAEPDDL